MDFVMYQNPSVISNFIFILQVVCNDDNNYYNLKRGEVAKLSFPEIEPVQSYEFSNSHGKTRRFLDNCSSVPPLHTCKLIQHAFKNHNDTSNIVKVNGKILYPNDLKSCIRIHELIKLKHKVDSEIIWLNENNYNIPPGCKIVDQEKLDLFKNSLLMGNENTCVEKGTPTVLTSDIALLTCNRWLNLSIVQMYADMLNKNSANSRTVLFANIEGSSAANMTRLVTGWKNESVESCCLIMNIKLDSSGNSLVADTKNPGNHWVCIYHTFKDNIWLYVDSLGYSRPRDLLERLEVFKSTVQEVYCIDKRDSVQIEAAHDHLNEATCTTKCIQGFPFQRNNGDICGAASIIFAVLLTNQSLPSQILQVISWKALPKVYPWLHELDRYGSFIRRVLISWYLEKNINLSLINMNDSQKKVSNCFNLLSI